MIAFALPSLFCDIPLGRNYPTIVFSNGERLKKSRGTTTEEGLAIREGGDNRHPASRTKLHVLRTTNFSVAPCFRRSSPSACTSRSVFEREQEARGLKS